MFSDYAARLLHHSHLRYSQQRNSNPLFHSAVDDRNDIMESLALRQSRAGISGKFGAFRAIDPEDEQEEFEEGDQDAMRSSWRPQDTQRTPGVEDSVSTEAEYSSGKDRAWLYNNTGNDCESPGSTSQHSEAPDDIMYDVWYNGCEDSQTPKTTLGQARELSSVSKPCENTMPGLDLETRRNAVPDSIESALIRARPARLDGPFGIVFVMVQASSFASSLFIFLRTDNPSTVISDTLYNAISSSTGILFWNVFLAAAFATLWLLTIRHCVRPLVQSTAIVVPTVLAFFSVFLWIRSSDKALTKYELQARLMQWSSLTTAVLAIGWSYIAYRRRRALSQAVDIIKLACIIVEDNRHLLIITIGNLALFILYSVVWLYQFERIFLRGSTESIGGKVFFLLSRDSWALGACMVFLYLWSFGVSSGIQRVAISAVVSRWYFHRHELPTGSSKNIARAALLHATTTAFGSACGASLMSLTSRLPILALPRRIGNALSIASYMVVSAPIYSLTNPLNLSVAAIQSISIIEASRSFKKHSNLESMHARESYLLAKMLLSAARTTTALGLGSIVSVIWARNDKNAGEHYAYTIGVIAGVIGWVIVGSIEGIISVVVDASLVCYSIDLPNMREGRTHCEAAGVFRSSYWDDEHE